MQINHRNSLDLTRIAWVIALVCALASSCLLVSCQSASTQQQALAASNAATKDKTVNLLCISDTHLTGSDDEHLQNLQQALDEAGQEDSGFDCVCLAGDGVDSATQEQYDQLKNNFLSYGYSAGAGNLFVAMGNHECYKAGDYSALWQQFETNWALERTYHQEIIGNVRLIALGSDQEPENWTHASYSIAELNWLDDLLAQDAVAGRYSVVICHHPVLGTVFGSLDDQYASKNRMDDSDALQAVLQKHNNVLYISGHSHEDLTNDGCLSYDESDLGPVYAHDGGVASLRDETGNGGASQGLYVSISSDQVTIDARDFTDDTSLWTKTFFRSNR